MEKDFLCSKVDYQTWIMDNSAPLQMYSIHETANIIHFLRLNGILELMIRKKRCKQSLHLFKISSIA